MGLVLEIYFQSIKYLAQRSADYHSFAKNPS
jgi:hypothetical protein